MLLCRLLPLRPVVLNNFFPEEQNTSNMQIWALDPWITTTPQLGKLQTSNGSIRPLYLIPQEVSTNSSNTAQNYFIERDSNSNIVYSQYKRSPRGRSFSPPKKKENDSAPVHQSRHSERFINVNNNNTDANNKDQFGAAFAKRLQKSTSSDHIAVLERAVQTTLSSGTSSSSGTSTRDSNWNRSLRSGIPVPVSHDTRIRFRSRQNEITKGPLSTSAQFYRAKSPSPQHSPAKSIVLEHATLVRQPFSSDCESPEFYTPPAEPHLAETIDSTVEESPVPSPPQSERFIQINSPKHLTENFTVLDTASSEVFEENPCLNRILSQASISSGEDLKQEVREENEETENTLIFGEKLYEPQTQLIRDHTSSSLDELDSSDSAGRFINHRCISKSEMNLQEVSDFPRKTVCSAPALNENLDHVTYENCSEPRIDTPKTCLPGAIVEPHYENRIEQVSPKEILVTTPKIIAPRKNSFPKTPLIRKNSVKVANKDLNPFPDSLPPFSKPKDAANEVQCQLESNDWEVTMKGLQGVVRLLRHHPNVLEGNMHYICLGLAKQIRNLRSQVARAACLVATEMFDKCKKPLDMDLEELAVPLLHRTADTNKFLRCDANAALDRMCTRLAPPRVVTLVATKGGGHHNAIVRCAAARLLCSLTYHLGTEKVFQLPKDTRDKILVMGANMLMEGNLDTRKHAKMMLGNLSSHSQFSRAMTEAVPAVTMRNIHKTLKCLM